MTCEYRPHNDYRVRVPCHRLSVEEIPHLCVLPSPGPGPGVAADVKEWEGGQPEEEGQTPQGSLA